MEQISEIIYNILPSLILSIVLGFWQKKQQKYEDERKKENNLRREREILQLDLLFASSELSYQTAMAVKRGNANGELDAALESHQQALTKFRDFERKNTVDI